MMISREQLKELILSNVESSEMEDLLKTLTDKFGDEMNVHFNIDEEQLDEIAETIAETFIPPKFDNEI